MIVPTSQSYLRITLMRVKPLEQSLAQSKHSMNASALKPWDHLGKGQIKKKRGLEPGLSCSSCRWVKQAPQNQLMVSLLAPSPGSPGSVTAIPPLKRVGAHPLQVPTFLCKEPLPSHSALLSQPPPAAGLNFQAGVWRHLGSVLISWLGFLKGRGLRGGYLVR